MKPQRALSIRASFKGAGVLLTGSTGFLAKAVVEKLLRDVPDVGHIYLLIRPRVKADGSRVDPRERIREEVLRNSAFRRLREQLGDRFESYCESKISCVAGDLTQERLGLDEAAFKELARKIKFIINSAATVVFDERLDLALNLNTLGPQRLMELAREAKACFVHVSTAYVSGRRTGPVPEALLDPMEAIDKQLPPGVPRPESFNLDAEIARLNELAGSVKAGCAKRFKQKGIAPESEEGAAQLRTALVNAGMRRAQSLGWNDTYTYTKFLGEQFIKQTHGTVPCIIVRPSIIESSLREPEPGWLDGLRMADPIIIGFGKGRLADFPANEKVALDIIPADFVANGILTAAAHIDAAHEAAGRGGKSQAPFDLITVASSSVNPMGFKNLYDYVREYFRKHPMTDRQGKPIGVPEWNFPTIEQYRRRIRNRYLRPLRAANFVLNGIQLPGTRKMRSRFRLLNTTMEQLLYYVDIYGPYVTLDCRFETGHGFELLQAVIPEERACFDYDPRNIRWRNYIQDVHIPGLKRNILRMESLPRTGAGEGRLLEEESEAAKKRRASPAVRGVPQTVVDICARGAERHGSKLLMEIRRSNPANMPASERGKLGGERFAVTRLTYAELFDRAGEAARRLIARLDLHPGDRMLLLGENCPEWALGYMAVSRACCTAVPLDRQMPAAEAAKLAQWVGAKGILISPALYQAGGDVFAPGHGLPPCLDLLNDLTPFPGHQWAYPEASIGSRALRDPGPESLASILFSSGTTKDPKGIMLSHANFVADALSVAEVLEPLETDRFMSVLPLHHALEFTGGFLIPMNGGASIHHIESTKDIETVMKLDKITVIIGVPRLFKLFMDRIKNKIGSAGTAARFKVALGKSYASALEAAGDAQARRRVFKQVHDGLGGHIRLFVSGGAALDPAIFNFFKEFGITIAEGYGLTETAPVIAVNPIAAAKAGAVGPAVPGCELRIDKPGPDGVGEILARGQMIMQGYWKNPAATEKAFENGWLRTGDQGRFDAAGWLHITGRSKDIIVTAAGKNVYPDEVEAALRNIKGVKELSVLGMPSRNGMGEEVVLIVVPEKEEHRKEIETAVQRICETLPSYQRVARLEFQNTDLPKTSTLKVQRNKLRDLYAAGNSTSGLRRSPLSSAPPSGGTEEKSAATGGIFVEVAHAVAEVAEGVTAAEIVPAMKLQMDLGIDSIGRVELLTKLESQLGLTIPEESTAKLFTVRDVLTVVESAQSAGRASGKTASGGRKHRLSDVHAGMRESLSKRVLQGMFSTSASVFMNSYLRVECHGLENLPAQAPYILTANHCSHLDSVAIREVLGKRASELHVMGARDYFFDTRLKSWFFTTFLNALPFDREENVGEALAACKAVLDNRRAILLFPEGTRSVTGELQSFKSGIGLLALELDVPVIPVHLRGTFESLPKGNSLPKPVRINVRIGPAADFGTMKAERGKGPQAELYRRAAARLRAQVEALRNAR